MCGRESSSLKGKKHVKAIRSLAISRGRLLPAHRVFSHSEIGEQARENLQKSLVLVHGGMAQDVGPILEMVTEKYLLRSARGMARAPESDRRIERSFALFAGG